MGANETIKPGFARLLMIMALLAMLPGGVDGADPLSEPDDQDRGAGPAWGQPGYDPADHRRQARRPSGASR